MAKNEEKPCPNIVPLEHFVSQEVWNLDMWVCTNYYVVTVVAMSISWEKIYQAKQFSLKFVQYELHYAKNGKWGKIEKKIKYLLIKMPSGGENLQ